MLNLERDVLPYLRRDITPAASVPTPPTGALLHAFYQRSIQHREDIKEVFADTYPKYLDINRPKEKAEFKKYRKAVYRNPFRSLRNRVGGALAYIRQADDFEVKFPKLPENMPQAARLENYTGRGFSPSGDAVSWFFSEVVPAYLSDPNAVFLTLPEWGTTSDAEYSSPTFQLFGSENVWMHKKGRFAVLCSPRRCQVVMGDGSTKNEGLVVYFCDHDSYTVARQVRQSSTGAGRLPSYDWEILGLETWAFDEKNPEQGFFRYDGPTDPIEGVTFVQEFNAPRHYCQGMPALKIGKVRIDKSAEGEELYESILADTVPAVKDGQQIKSDIQVETNFHVSSKEWQRAPATKCRNAKCKNGKVSDFDPETKQPTHSTCPICHGSGLDYSGSGLDIIYVTDVDVPGMVPGTQGAKMPSGPPGGFIPRPIEALQELTKQFDRTTIEAYTTINMQFVRETPLEVSGASKRYDREEMYRELNNQGVHLVGYLLQWGYIFLDCQRYGPSGRQGIQTPTVLVPVRYNLENAELVRQELNDAKLNKWDTTLVEVLELKFLEYSAGKTSDAYRRYELRLLLDPYKNRIAEIDFYQLGIIYMMFKKDDTQKLAFEQVWMSINFDAILNYCVNHNADFWERDLAGKETLMNARNDELIGELNEFSALTPEDFPQAKFKPLVDLQQMGQTQESFSSGMAK